MGFIDHPKSGPTARDFLIDCPVHMTRNERERRTKTKFFKEKIKPSCTLFTGSTATTKGKITETGAELMRARKTFLLNLMVRSQHIESEV